MTHHLMLLRLSSSGAEERIRIYEWMCNFTEFFYLTRSVITDGDQGVLLSFEADSGASRFYGMARVRGASVELRGAPAIPGQEGPIELVVQGEDGGYVGRVDVFDGEMSAPMMVALDGSGGLRWTVANDEPQVAAADGGVIGKSGIVYDSQGMATGRMGMVGLQSWRGNAYQIGSVEQVLMRPVVMAFSLWAQGGANPSQNRVASRPWYFGFSFENTFSFTPMNPAVRWDLTVDITNRAAFLKKAALDAAKKAYSQFPVVVFEGQRADRVVHVVNSDAENPPGCGVTVAVGTDYRHEVGYVRQMQEAQDALGVMINNAEEENAALAGPELVRAIGRGVGNTGAHEIAHRFLNLCCEMDADPETDPDARGTFNATGCNGRRDPSPWTGYWPNPIIYLHWQQHALDALRQCLGGGWNNLHPCHN